MKKNIISEDIKKMVEKVQKIGLKREAGYLYFVDKQGDISRSLMARGKKEKTNTICKSSKIVKIGLKREAGYLYFVDKQGDISRSLMARGRKK
jgi:predicted RNA-binding protein